MASKRLNAVWRSGAGEEVWYTGLSFADFEAKGKDLFNRNMRMTDLDTNGGISAVWHPGSDAQVCLIGLSRDDFHAKDKTFVQQGLRLVSLRASDGRHAAVWRSGTGRQEVLSTPRLNDLLAADSQYFASGLRIQTFQQDFGKKLFYGVWRSDLGSGAQWCKTGMNESQFKAEDQKQSAAGLRLTQITSINGITGIWRSGSDGAAWALEQKFDDFSALETRNTSSGLRMVSLSVGYV
jgi:hypothetical protein